MPKKRHQEKTIQFQRHAMGLLGLVCLLSGVSLYLGGELGRQAVAGILTRVGFLLSTIWLAWPQLEALKSRLSIAVLGGIVAVLLVVAIRPRLFPIAIVAIVAGLFINGAMRRFASSYRDPRNRK